MSDAHYRSARFTLDEVEALRDLAHAAQTSVSDFIRVAALEAANAAGGERFEALPWSEPS